MWNFVSVPSVSPLTFLVSSCLAKEKNAPSWWEHPSSSNMCGGGGGGGGGSGGDDDDALQFNMDSKKTVVEIWYSSL